MRRYGYFLMTMLVLIATASFQSLSPYIYVKNSKILSQGVNPIIYADYVLNENFDDEIFRSSINCRNNNLQILSLSEDASKMILNYENIQLQSKEQITIKTAPNENPQPFIEELDHDNFTLAFNCFGPYEASNYWNEVTVSLPGDVSFSFLLNCDPDNRHKQFEIGYLFLALINACIIIGVAMHSYAWSIRVNLQPLRFQLRWAPFLIFSLIGSFAIIILLKFVAASDTKVAFDIIRYFGVVVSIPCFFLCCNEAFYLVRQLQKPVIKIIRWCDLISLACTICVGVLAFFYESWIFYNCIGGCICVASIKIFHFKSLKQAFRSMAIVFGTAAVLGGILHFILPQSYNDYAGDLSSPLFLQVPDMIENLFKKCSWLPIIDVIIPGVTLSYLRVYDQNKSSKFGGVYTLIGNISFVSATILWIGIEFIWPWSVPFSFITYPILMLTIFIVAWRRSQWFDLYHGRFLQEMNMIDAGNLEENRFSFGEHVNHRSMEDLLMPPQSQNPSASDILE